MKTEPRPVRAEHVEQRGPADVNDPAAAGCADAHALLVEVIAAQSARPSPVLLDQVAETVTARFGASLQAMLFYGSCLRSADPTDGLVDVYALVDDYRHAYPQRYLRVFNSVLPPNVFYMECPLAARLPGGSPPENARLRIKCTVLSLAAFERGTRHWFHSYLWGRFAQPARIVRVRDESARRRVNEALAGAVLTFQRRSIPCLSGAFTAEALWTEGLRRCYAAELRVEGNGRATRLVADGLADYQARTQASALLLGLQLVEGGQYRRVPATTRSAALLAGGAWAVRRWQGRILSILRLVKSAGTFKGGVDYVAWKIERHSGVHIEVTPRLRRHPLIYGWGVLFRLLRKEVLK
ncbi:MAG: hypothetical protein EPN72_09080 [Nevskiaceae bacterium]|nr:MAG: hypothetical protein EPN63_08420 [Nevskiaceae bacterium]TBR72591.1 MAG: hypothetical protein EPN72_09080 [Nevskiaceae bacterium]